MKAEVISLNDYRKTSKYDKVFQYALDNWNTMVDRATVYFGRNPKDVPSIADQIEFGTGCPYSVAEEIAQSISISMAICNK